MHRWLTFLLVLLFLPCSAFCETGAERLAQLDIISQYDDRLQDERFYYKDKMFRVAGCKPASVTNAIVALLGTPETNVPDLLVELCRGLILGHNKSAATIDLSPLPSYLRNPRSTAQQVLQLIDPVSSIIPLSSDAISLDPAAFIAQYLAATDAHPLFLFEMPRSGGTPWIVDLVAALCEHGRPDARVALSTVALGTNDTDGPFRSGKNGHYASLFLEAGEFHHHGTFYLLDSYPRGLRGEDYGYQREYPSCYPFVEESRNAFNSIYAPTRISPTIVQFDLLPGELETLQNTDGAARATLQLQQFNSAKIFSSPYFMLYLP